MYGDFTLNPFLYRDDVSRVLWQQGRVQLDSDANEQTEAILRAMRTAIADIIGQHGGEEGAFAITREGADRLRIGRGFYYVDGIRVANGEALSMKLTRTPFMDVTDTDKAGILFHEQPHYPGHAETGYFDEKKEQLVYLDVWERHLSSAEDDSLREVALLGPDTASRAVIVWQVRVLEPGELLDKVGNNSFLPFTLDGKGTLRARAVVNEEMEACIIAPEARYRGPENRLYRVEIHDVDEKNGDTYFKWSQDNASIAYPVRDVQGTTVTLESLGRDDRTAISIGDWVELVDDDVSLQLPGSTPTLVQVIGVDRSRLEVTVKSPFTNTLEPKRRRRAILRRWATKPVKLEFVTSAGIPQTPWLHLTDGVTVQLAKEPNAPLDFRPGDYWLIPARTATGDVIWPQDETKHEPAFLSPHGVQHHYAPLARWDKTTLVDLRETYKKLTQL